jgi:NADH:ubiquinone oxidoreductase subunit D
MEFYERVSGARMHTALYKQFGFNFNLFNKLLINDILFLISRGSRYVSGSFIALLNNKSLKTRLSNIGIFSNKKLLNYGITGIIARSSGINIDIRLSSNTLSNMYNFLTFKSFLGRKSDSLDRFIIRSKEVIESFKIINQLLLFIKPFEVFKKNKFLSMESLINHFKENIFNKPLNNSLTYGLVESPKGIVMVNLVLSKSNYIYRLSLRSPVAHNMNLLPTIGNCQTFADFVATFCSLDVVLGEIDR